MKSKRTGEYFQAEDLIKRELVPQGWNPPHKDAKEKPLKYPIKHTNQIIRKRLNDGSEWLLSYQVWTGLDQAGNYVGISMDLKEMYDDVYPIVKVVPENPRDRDSKMIRQFQRMEHRQVNAAI